MTQVTNESIRKSVQITCRTAVAGVVALSAIATMPVVASAALPGEPDHLLIDLWDCCQQL